MDSRQWRRWWWLGIVLCLLAQPAAAITLQIDYTYDSANFFGANNPQGAAAGAQAKAALESAASYFSSILTDSFSAIQTPSPYHSSVSNGVVTWDWHEDFENPSTGADVSVLNPTVAANRYIIYAGANNLTGAIAGIGAPGGYDRGNAVTGTNSFSQTDQNQINSNTNSFFSAVDTRGQTSGFSRWGGAVSFDNSARTWHFDSTTLPSAGESDFYSVALHEIAHALGFGETSSDGPTSWTTLVNGSTFVGANSQALNGFAPVPLSADLDHWATGTKSVVYGTSTMQETLMDPDLTDGTRKRLTALDAAALKDMGWQVTTPPGPSGDYNNNGVVDAADYVVWRNYLNQSVTLPNDTTPGTVTQADYTVWRNDFGATFGSGSGPFAAGAAVPEPASIALAILSGCMFWYYRGRGRRHFAYAR